MDYRTGWKALDFGADFRPPGKIGNFSFQSVVFAAGHFFGILRILSPILQKIFNLLFVIRFTSPFAGVLVNPARQFKVICSIVHQSGNTGHIRLRRIFILCVTIQLLTKRFKKRIVVLMENKLIAGYILGFKTKGSPIVYGYLLNIFFAHQTNGHLLTIQQILTISMFEQKPPLPIGVGLLLYIGFA